MAYDSKNDPGYIRVNLYSSPSHYGTAKKNNAKAITDSKYKMSKWGDESGGCYEGMKPQGNKKCVIFFLSKDAKDGKGTKRIVLVGSLLAIKDFPFPLPIGIFPLFG